MMRAERVCESVLKKKPVKELGPGSKVFIFILEPRGNQRKILRSEGTYYTYISIYSFVIFYSTIHLYFQQIFIGSQALS